MTRDNPERLAQKVLEKDKLIPLGEYKAREDGDNYLTTYPSIASDWNDIDDESAFVKYLDQETGATVTIPVDELEED